MASIPSIIRETGEVVISIENALNLTISHGIIVGAIHRIVPMVEDDIKKFNRTHSTILFYANGFIHNCTGLEIGSLDTNTSGFKWLIQTIPGVGCKVEGNFLVDLSNDEKTNKILESGTAIHYIFRSPSNDKKQCSFLQKNKGLIAMNKVISNMAKNDLCELVEMW